MEYPGRAGLWWQLVCRREAAGGGCRGDLCGTYRHLAGFVRHESPYAGPRAAAGRMVAGVV